MKNQLPQDEIEKLFTFVESKNMPYKDVQYEIVDHLASAMEDLKEENPEWPYSLCLEQIYNKFPITGFALLQMEKEEALNKYWKSRLKPYLFSYFKLPKIILTLALFIGFQQIFNSIEPVGFGYWEYGIAPNMLIYFLLLIVNVPISLYFKRRVNTINIGSVKKKGNSESLLYIKAFNTASHILTFSLMGIPLYIATLTIPNYDAFVFHGFHSCLLSWFIVGMLMHWHLTLIVFPPLLRAEAEERYAHINLKVA